MPEASEIIKLMPEHTREDAALVTKAYNFSKKAHENHKRYSGENYFLHTFATAKKLAELGMGAKTIAAGFLHDTIEDAEVKPETLEKEFGKDVLFLVEGVTKLGTLKYWGASHRTESLRRLFLAMAKDLRVLIIKLCDRLHNMQTLEHVPKEKQKRIAMETMEIYASLAYRLGIRALYRELEDLSFYYNQPEDYRKVKELLKQKNKENEANLQKISKEIKKALGKEGMTRVTMEYRLKHLWSLYSKLKRKEMDINKIYDISALRIIVPTVSDCYRALGIIHGIWRPLPGRIKDYIALPKTNGYQSIHTTIFTGDGGIVEIQIRTDKMNRESEFGVAAHLSYKERNPKGSHEKQNQVWLKRILPSFAAASLSRYAEEDSKTEERTDKVPKWIRELAESQTDSLDPEQFMQELRSDFFGHRVFVFTPKGEVVDLPTDSSTIDFAYAIHSDIGNRLSGAKVNGKMVSLETKLQNGDIVEILTRKNMKPSAKWLEHAKTSVARRHIRNSLEKGENPWSGSKSKSS